MRYIFICAFLIIAGCETKVEVPKGLDLENNTYTFCDETKFESVKIIYWFAGGSTILKTIEQFDKPGCIDSDRLSVENQTLSYSYNSAAKMLKETRLKSKIRFTNQVEVNKRNLNAYCGFHDWRLNSEKVITNENCDGDVFSYGDFREYEVYISNEGLNIDGITFLKFN